MIEGFKSTLEEVTGADLIVHVVDGSHPDPREQIRSVREVIREVGAGEVIEIIAINKSDIAPQETMMQLLREEPNSYAISTRTGFGIQTLVAAVEAALPRPKVEIKAVIPFHRGDLVSAIHERGEVISEEYLPEGTSITARVDGQLVRQIEALNV